METDGGGMVEVMSNSGGGRSGRMKMAVVAETAEQRHNDGGTSGNKEVPDKNSIGMGSSCNADATEVMLNGGGGTRLVARQKGSEEHTEAQLLKPAVKERSNHSTHVEISTLTKEIVAGSATDSLRERKPSPTVCRRENTDINRRAIPLLAKRDKTLEAIVTRPPAGIEETSFLEAALSERSEKKIAFSEDISRVDYYTPDAGLDFRKNCSAVV
ncbi:hypothetical protein B296_00028919 [Ensete ventricosum]|uniref:Uncharacterized protein n=1 Tax=Ensete ventricosum TaxID=4639 RepID=A0A426YRA2_ENSVE|nr:hypothetical protein B296_00028919 [Ensete ventricosum]